MANETPKASKVSTDKSSVVVIKNFITARPPQRTQFNLDDWRSALVFAEMPQGNRRQLYDLYADVMLDPHLSAQWGKRMMNITNTDLLFTVDGKDVDELIDLMDSPEFEMLLKEIMNAIAHGITVMELGSITVNEEGENKTRLTVYNVPRKHIRPKEKVITQEQSGENSTGIKYQEGAYQNYVAEIGQDDDFGLILKAVPYVLLKKGAVGDWALFVQLFGQPFREYKYDGYDDTVRIKLEEQAQAMGSAPYIILPDGSTVTLHDTKTNPSGEVHNKLVSYCDEMISILLLGNTETTKSSKSSGYAQSETHMQTQMEVFIADKKKVRRVLNRIIKPILYNLGFPVKGGVFHFKEEVEAAKRLDKLKIYQMMKQIGVPFSDDDVYKDTGVAKPENYDELKSKQEQQDAQNLDPAQEEDNNQGNQDKKQQKQNKQSASKKKSSAKLFDDLRIMLADFFDLPRR
jgi:phage gp29-like protein